MRDEYMFETAEDCCEKYFFIQGEDCLAKDICLDTVITLKPPGSLPTSKSFDCDLNIWHPSSGFQQCTNR